MTYDKLRYKSAIKSKIAANQFFNSLNDALLEKDMNAFAFWNSWRSTLDWQKLVNSFCKPHLSYATECLQLSHTAIIKLKSAWFCALSKIFHVKGNDVDFISEMCERYCFETEVAIRQDRFCRKLAMMNSPLFILFIDSND